jgi:hypothetical protein
VLGPGYGESVVVHLGSGDWLVVDSCIDTTDPAKPVAPLRYLRALGVNVDTAVRYIFVSHWDDDHIRGLSEVVEACPNSRFIASAVFPDDKFIQFVGAMSIGSAATDGAGVRNMKRILETLFARGQVMTRAAPNREIHSSPVVKCWSPSDYDSQEFLMYLAQMHPRAAQPLRKAIPASGNLTSVVVSINWEQTSALLGADMEYSSDVRQGWGAIVTEAQRTRWASCDLVKIPHHGSRTGHDDRMWASLVKELPISVIAPFGRGPIAARPPRSTDIRRISERSSAAYVTARHRQPSKTSKHAAVARSLREGNITMTSPNVGLGIVRHRYTIGGAWKSETFGSAYRVK